MFDYTPHFTNDVIEELERSEQSFEDRSFGETPYTWSEQLSLLGDSEPLVSEKPKSKSKIKSEFATCSVVDGVQVFEALAAEIERSTGVVNGKIRVYDSTKTMLRLLNS